MALSILPMPEDEDESWTPTGIVYGPDGYPFDGTTAVGSSVKQSLTVLEGTDANRPEADTLYTSNHKSPVTLKWVKKKEKVTIVQYYATHERFPPFYHD